MKQETRSNLQKPGTQRTEREQNDEQLKPLQQPGREDVSLDNDELEETGREQTPGRREHNTPERTTERSDRRL